MPYIVETCGPIPQRTAEEFTRAVYGGEIPSREWFHHSTHERSADADDAAREFEVKNPEHITRVLYRRHRADVDN